MKHLDEIKIMKADLEVTPPKRLINAETYQI